MSRFPVLLKESVSSAKAADDIDMLSPLLDGIILFDNETWYKKTRSQKSTLAKKEKGFAEKMGLVKVNLKSLRNLQHISC